MAEKTKPVGPLADQMVETWRINHRVNVMLIDNITDAGMQSTLSAKGGRDVARQFAHVHNVRLMWLDASAKDLAERLEQFDPKTAPTKAALKQHHAKSADAIADWLARGAETGKVKGFPRGVVSAFGYLLAHEAHHRGSILLTLKQTGQKIDQKTQYRIWEWGSV